MRRDLQEVFEGTDWSGRGGKAPRSGQGSTLAATERLRAALPGVFERYGVRQFVDAPCGDWTWMQAVDLTGIDYLGADIVDGLVEENRRRHADDNIRFEVVDITSSPLPPSDLFMCRECLFHLKFWLRWAFFENFAASDGRYLMTTIDHVHENKRLGRNGGFRRFDPRLAPFGFPEPLEIISENHDGIPAEDASDPERSAHYRSMGIWSIDQVREVVAARRAQQDDSQD